MPVINQIDTSNTFFDWLIATQGLIEHANYFSSNVELVLTTNTNVQIANTNVNNSINTMNVILNTANSVLQNCNIVLSNANTASNNANTAANNANSSANNAQTASNNANTAANNAQTSSNNANTAANSANTANTNAWSAVNVTVQQVLAVVYPVGSIYINSTDSTNPGTLLGFGTWTAFGAGRVPVGFDSGDALFNTAEETGGSKDAIVVSHDHTATSTVTDPGHTHNYVASASGEFVGTGVFRAGVYGLDISATTANTTGITVATSIGSTGSSGTNANLPPYITVYMWKRTS